jgi:hypothetical protein
MVARAVRDGSDHYYLVTIGVRLVKPWTAEKWPLRFHPVPVKAVFHFTVSSENPLGFITALVRFHPSTRVLNHPAPVAAVT